MTEQLQTSRNQMTDLSIHKKNIETYNICEILIKSVIEDLHLGKAKHLRIKGNNDYNHYLDIYYGHLIRIKELKNSYLKQNNLVEK